MNKTNCLLPCWLMPESKASSVASSAIDAHENQVCVAVDSATKNRV
jgi:hypothetical protein